MMVLAQHKAQFAFTACATAQRALFTTTRRMNVPKKTLDEVVGVKGGRTRGATTDRSSENFPRRRATEQAIRGPVSVVEWW